MIAVCPIIGEVDVYASAGAARSMAREMGFGPADAARIEIVVRELAFNIIRYAGRGEIRLSRVTSGNRTGLQVEAEDHGPGIADLELALQDGYSSGGKGLGAGLPAVRRLMDTFEIQTEVGKGTLVRAVRWLRRSTDWLHRWWHRD